MRCTAIKDVEKTIKEAFAKYGFEPMDIDIIRLNDIEMSVREIVVNHIYNCIRKIVLYTQKKVKAKLHRPKRTDQDIGHDVSAVLFEKMVWENQCIITDADGRKLLLFQDVETETAMGMSSSDRDYASVTDSRGIKIFSAEICWKSVDLEKLIMVYDGQAQKAFMAISLKAQEL